MDLDAVTSPLEGQECGNDAVIRSIKSFQRPDHKISVFQTVSTISLFLMVYAILLIGLSHGHLLVLLLAPLAAGLAVRIFILQHDCGHGSLFRAQWANSAVGRFCSVLTFTPYDHWKRHHAIHHSGWNNMASRGRLSDMYSDCLTVAEYRAMSRFQKILYRISRNPVVSLLIVPPFIFFIVYRIPFDAPRPWKLERWGTHMTSLCILLLYGAMSYIFGLKTVMLAAFAVIYPASVAGVWLFLLQHRFEGVHWETGPRWNAFSACLTGCSFLKLPAILNWFSGSIGLHHVHHAAPGIPNYRLAACHEAHPIFRQVKVIGLWEGLKEITNDGLWDEDARCMVSFAEAHSATKLAVQA